MLRSHEKGHGRGLPFRPGSAAHRARVGADADELPEQGGGGGGDRYGLVESYEWFSAEYGWSPDYIEAHLTDEQFALYAEKLAKRRQRQAFAELDRIVSGTSWGVSIAFDQKGRNARKWQGIRNRSMPSQQSRGLSGAALEQAVMALAATDPSLVKVQAGA